MTTIYATPKNEYHTYMTKPLMTPIASSAKSKQDDSLPHPIYTAVSQQCQICAEQLKRYSRADDLPIDTRQAPDLDIGFGQQRALKALRTALDIDASGYHVFAAGENGLGKRTIISRLLHQIADHASAPNDWVYVHNFSDPRTPLALALPAGQAVQLQQKVGELWTQVKETIQASQYDTAPCTLRPLFDSIHQPFSSLPDVTAYLDALCADMAEHTEQIVHGNEEAAVSIQLATTPSQYTVNIMVSHDPDGGTPVIFEGLPTHLNLLGHIDQTIQSGTVTTDVSMIRTGALHRANGGYLVLEASHLLEQPYAWQSLKQALQTRTIKPSTLASNTAFASGLSLEPVPIALSIKVILLGEADLYYELLELEPEFDAVFKVRADFHDDVPRTHEHELALVAKMADIIDDAKLLPFDNSAQAALLEHLSLQSENQDRLSLHSDRLIKLLHESSRHARLKDKDIVDNTHVTQAISDMDERSGYLRDLYWNELKTGQQLLNTQGKAVGQVNALTVVSYADSEFGMPARLTAVIQPNIGGGEVLDIERDVDLGGSLHAKGMLIMTSYLRALFSQHHALNFSASLAFEQSYAHIDGDSATVSEGCALLSALANTPINQALAITGSMNQLGEVQAVGGINAKIAGFYDACCEQGLTGQQGVVIPMANVKQLMLRDDIIAAVKAGRFRIYGVHTLSQALTLMTGLPIDTKNKKGRYRKDTLFGKVLRRLMLWDENQNAEDNDDDKQAKKKAKKKRKKKRRKKDNQRQPDANDNNDNKDETTKETEYL